MGMGKRKSLVDIGCEKPFREITKKDFMEAMEMDLKRIENTRRDIEKEQLRLLKEHWNKE